MQTSFKMLQKESPGVTLHAMCMFAQIGGEWIT